MALGCIGIAARTRRALRVDAVSLDDFDASGRHRAGDLFDRDPERRSELLRDGLAVPLARSEGEIPSGLGRERGDGPTHDLAVAFDLDLADRNSDGQVVDVVSLAADDKGPPQQELAGLCLLRHLLRKAPVRASTRESCGPRLAVREGEFARLPQ